MFGAIIAAMAAVVTLVLSVGFIFGSGLLLDRARGHLATRNQLSNPAFEEGDDPRELGETHVTGTLRVEDPVDLPVDGKEAGIAVWRLKDNSEGDTRGVEYADLCIETEEGRVPVETHWIEDETSLEDPDIRAFAGPLQSRHLHLSQSPIREWERRKLGIDGDEAGESMFSVPVYEYLRERVPDRMPKPDVYFGTAEEEDRKRRFELWTIEDGDEVTICGTAKKSHGEMVIAGTDDEPMTFTDQSPGDFTTALAKGIVKVGGGGVVVGFIGIMMMLVSLYTLYDSATVFVNFLL